jgi:endo-1,4-beta-xylanase
VGNISTNGQIRSDFTTWWTQFTPENEGKWGSVQASVPSDNFNWSALDTEYQFCQSNNIIFKEHNFIWGSQQPSGNVQASDVQKWMNAFCSRYPNTKIIDVVNEPLNGHNPAKYASNIGGTGSSGWDWIVNALTWAHQACPNALLLVNDYNTVEYQGDHDNFVSLINAVKNAGAPIDGIGAQAHGTLNESTSQLQSFIDDFNAKTGLPVYITEFDLATNDDNMQNQVMQSHFSMFYSDNNVAGITLWGYITGATWQKNPNSGLMASDGTMRPAMTWLANFLSTHPH